MDGVLHGMLGILSIILLTMIITIAPGDGIQHGTGVGVIHGVGVLVGVGIMAGLAPGTAVGHGIVPGVIIGDGVTVAAGIVRDTMLIGDIKHVVQQVVLVQVVATKVA